MAVIGGLIYFLLVFLKCYSFFCVIRPFGNYVGQMTLLVLGCALALLALSNEDGARLAVWAHMGFLQVLVHALGHIAFGALVGLVVFIAAEAVLIGARIGDLVRGAQFAEQINPLLETTVSHAENALSLAILGLSFSSGLYQIPLALIFLRVDETAALCSGIVEALDRFLVLARLDALRLSGDAIRFGLCAAAPVLVFCLVFDIGAALFSRVLPRFNASFEFLPLKMLLGLMVLVLAFVFSGQELEVMFRDMLNGLYFALAQTGS